MTTPTLSTKGRIRIPYGLRKRYGLKKGDKLNFVDEGGVISLAPASKDPVRQAKSKWDRSKGK